MSKDAENAPYIDNFFEFTERKYEDCDVEERALFLKKLKGNYIVDQLDAELDRSLKRFFE